MRAVRRRRTLTTAFAVVMVLASTALAGCDPAVPDTYVALGDSYVAGPLIPDQSPTTPGCLRSDANYPSFALPGIKVSRLTDVSCSGATTADLFTAQDVTPGPANPPQLDALDSRTKVVTLGIGGNDIGFLSILETCVAQSLAGPGCKPTYVHDGRDELQERIAATGPDVLAALQAIDDRAPQAEVFVVGYPTILPETGTGCYPVVPILPADVVYLRGVTKALNAMLAERADEADVHFVDVATPSIGHDVCQGPTTRWVEGLVPTFPAAPVHPNGTGMQVTAAVVVSAISAVVTS